MASKIKVDDSSGYTYLSPSSNAERYKSKLKTSALPPKVDLRQHMTPIEDQKRLSSCTANAVAGAYEYLAKKYLSKKAFDVSRLFIYYNARLRAGGAIKDAGSHIQYAVDSLMKVGACRENLWPYVEAKVNEKPSEKAYEVAPNFKVEQTKFVPVKLDEWKKTLADGYPIVFGIALFNSFDNCTNTHGIVSMPEPNEAARSSHRLHALLCVGYSDPDQMFIVRNSWGEKWGDNGYCYLPYNYVINDKFNLGDSWVFGRTTPIPDSDETWIDDKKSVINDGKGYNKKDFVIYNQDDYSDFDVWKYIEVEEYEEEEPEEFAALEEYEGTGEYDDILEEYDEEEEEEYDEEEEEEEYDEEEEEEYDEEEEEEYDEEEEEEYDEEEEEEYDEEEEEEYDEEEEEEEEYDEEEEEEEEYDEEEEEEEEYDEEEEEEEEYDEEEEEEEEYDEEEEEEEEYDEEEEEEEEYDEEEEEEEEYDEEEEEEYDEEEEEEEEEYDEEEEEEEEYDEEEEEEYDDEEEEEEEK